MTDASQAGVPKPGVTELGASGPDVATADVATADVATSGEPRGLTGLPYAAVPIKTQRLLLRPLKNTDLTDVHSYQKREDVVRYLMWEVRDHDQSEQHLAKRRAMTQLTNDGDGLVFAVELPDPAGGHGRVVGDMSVFLKSAEHGQLEVGWVFHPAVHGHGFATEAATAMLELCFDTLGAHRVFAEMDPRNDASARLCERLGMRLEALFREDMIFKGEWGDTAVYGMLATEWTPPADSAQSR